MVIVARMESLAPSSKLWYYGTVLLLRFDFLRLICILSKVPENLSSKPLEDKTLPQLFSRHSQRGGRLPTYAG